VNDMLTNKNLMLNKDFFRLRAVVKGWDADRIAKSFVNRHKLEGRKTAIIFDDKQILIYGQRKKRKWKCI